MFINTNPAASTTRYPRQLLDSGFVEGLTTLLGPITSIELILLLARWGFDTAIWKQAVCPGRG